MEKIIEDKEQSSEVIKEEEPIKILGFLCNWCSYAGADLAGTSRFQYAPSLRIVRVMCSGRVDPILIFEGFKNKADGILVGGCHFGDCHYIDGNYHAYYKIKFAQKVLEKVGIDKRRLRLEWISAAEGKRFSEVVNSFNEEIKELGKISLSDEQLELLESLMKVFTNFRLRWLIGNKLKIVEQGNVYGNKIDEEQFDKLLDEIVSDEILRYRILKTIEKEARTAPEIGNILNVQSEKIMANLLNLMNNRKVEMTTKHHDAYFIKEEA